MTFLLVIQLMDERSEIETFPRIKRTESFWGRVKEKCSSLSEKCLSSCDPLLCPGEKNKDNLGSFDRRSRRNDDTLFLLMMRKRYPKLWRWTLQNDCLICCPQSASLPQKLSLEDFETHVLTPTKIAGEYATLNRKIVVIVGNEICTKKGFEESRHVRLLRMEDLRVSPEIAHNTDEMLLKVVHISRPFQGGIDCLDEPAWIDGAMMQKYIAMMKSHPEMEPIFDDMNIYIREFNFVAEYADTGLDRIEPSAEASLAGEWNQLVHAILSTGFLKNKDGDISRERRLQIAQFVENYLAAGVYSNLFPWLSRRFCIIDAKFALVVHKLQHHTMTDIGIAPEFQCPVSDAVEELKLLHHAHTPMEKLLCMKRTQAALNRAIQANFDFNHRQTDFPDLTTDETVLLIVYTILQAYPDSTTLVSNLIYTKTFHFIPHSTSALGFALSHFEVAIDWLLAKIGLHVPDKNVSEEDLACVQISDVNFQESLTDFGHGWNERVVRERSTSTIESVRRARPFPSSTLGVAQMVMIYGDGGVRQSGNEAQTLQIVSEEDGSEVPCTVSEAACGPHFFSVVTGTGQLQTWGLAEYGRLGHGPDHDLFFPVERPLRVMTLMSDIVEQVACGSHHVVCVTRQGQVYAWGDNRCGQLGTGSIGEDRGFYPVEVSALQGKHIKQVACGNMHTLALTSGGQVYSWGRANGGRLGRIPLNQTGHNFPNPGLVENDWSYRILETTSQPFSLVDPEALNEQRAARNISTGSNEGTASEHGETGGDSVVWISAGWAHCAAVTQRGAVFSWGVGGDGRLGHGSHCSLLFPAQIRSLASSYICIKKACAGYAHTIFLSSDGAVFATGLNKFGQVGIPYFEGLDMNAAGLTNRPALLVPLRIQKLRDTKIIDICAGENHNVAHAENGQVYTWGMNLANQCAQGRTVEMQPEPLEVAILSGAKKVVCGASHTMIII